MSLTQQDLAAIDEIVKRIVKDEVGQTENRLNKRIESAVGDAKDELLEEIRKVGVEVVENRSAILQHIHNNPAWKHAA